MPARTATKYCAVVQTTRLSSDTTHSTVGTPIQADQTSSTTVAIRHTHTHTHSWVTPICNPYSQYPVPSRQLPPAVACSSGLCWTHPRSQHAVCTRQLASGQAHSVGVGYRHCGVKLAHTSDPSRKQTRLYMRGLCCRTELTTTVATCALPDIANAQSKLAVGLCSNHHSHSTLFAPASLSLRRHTLGGC